MSSQVSRIERAAGGVVIRTHAGMREVLMIDDAFGHVAFPKGHLEPGESWEVAAVREVAEETGISARVVAPLGRVSYRIQRDGVAVEKQVRLFLMEAVEQGDTPRPQLEELKGAYFLSWEKAVAKQMESGYRNWDWLLPKAKALLAWHDGRFALSWRKLRADTPLEELLDGWSSVQGVYQSLVETVVAELKEVAGALMSAAFSGNFKADFPRELPNEDSSLRGAIEHTLLKANASVIDVENLCREALDNRFRAVCVNPQHVSTMSRMLQPSDVGRCAVVGFPLGAQDTDALGAETAAVIRAGATEVDMVIPVGSMVEDDIWTVYRHIECVVKSAKSCSPDVKVKAILETYFLEPDQLIKASVAAIAAGADYVKTSTGFAPEGANIADVSLMAVVVQGRAGVKASGGIKSRAEALNFLRFGANRLGTSSGLAIVRE